MNNIEITLDNNIVCGDPKIAINSKHNSTPFYVPCKNGSQTIVTELELGAYDTLQITLLDRDHKTDSDVQTSVEILDLYIDDINLQHLIFTGTLYPKYDLNFAQQHRPPRSYCPGTIFYTNGVFELDIQLPIHKFLVDSYEQKIS
jgi:hypothetical protein